MASTLRVFPTPAALRVGGVLGRGFRSAGAPVFHRNCDGFRSVRCSAEDSAVESPAREEKKDVAVHAEPSSSSSSLQHLGDSLADQFGGWYGVEEEEKHTWKVAALQVATGFLLALGVSLSYYVWCQKQGRRVIPTPPTLTQIQLPSFLKRSSQEPEHSDHEVDIDEESKENTVKNSFGKQSDKSLQSNKEKVVESEDVKDTSNKGENNVVDGEKQIVSDTSGDEAQRTASVPATETSTSPQDQGKASDGAKDESRNSASEPAAKFSTTQLESKIASDGSKDEPKLSVSEPAAESTSLQLDRKSTSDSNKDGPRVPVAKPASESESLRQDTEKIQKSGSVEPQLPPSQPRKSRRSQRNKRKFSGRRGKVVVPAAVDPIQEQTLAVLQALKVVEEGSDPRAICKRRDYARWIIASSSTLTRSPAHKVFPAMYIEGATELAFVDVTPDDPDFAYIQGLAEAGLIPSNFSLPREELGDRGYDSDLEEMNFFPDSPVSRQELVSWKMALGRRTLPATDKEALQAKSGFLDIDRIDRAIWPALSLDLDSGEDSIITSAFGLTRRFQPDKAATIGQAAIALAHGDSSERFGEELARLQAERLADEAVAADEASEAQKQKELNELFDGQLSIERQQKEQAQKLFEELKAEFEKFKEEKDADKDVLLKDKATVESEKELLQHLRAEVDEQLRTLSMRVMQISVEQEKLQSIRLKSESDEEELSRLMSEVEVEKQALFQARLWAEDEARKARNHAEALEQTRKQKAGREHEGTFSERSWHHSGTKAKTELENFLQRAPLQDVVDKESWGFLTRNEVEDPALLSCYLVIHWEPYSGFSLHCKSKVSRFARHSFTVFNKSWGWNQELRQ
ncbi:hypothetical protein KC19_7G088400 [Ceratodon purpureus]|uniref:SLH domain-containing protein n=1 Tax=Ceratodon purpureus TaxID=3225 RepID=A0A8T0H8W9_CERPU|nr:hypothetical protein KC19_7G088400 [Ceratodon purpureus]